ncbi:MAG: hypothetical protein QOI95_679 [Acidimicrobiaceae bacterium]|jgi:anti-anti-sigma factor
MTALGVTLTTRSDDASVLVVVEGEIDLSNARFVEDQLLAAITNRTLTVTVDLTAVSYIDSIGMRVLFALSSRLEVAQIGFKIIASIGSPARRVIEISGFDVIVEVVESDS